MKKNEQKMVSVLYGYIGFALVMIAFNIFGIFRPYADVLAAVSLFAACVYIGFRSK